MNNENTASKIPPKMNNNIGEQVAYGSNLSSYQINEHVLPIKDVGTKKI